MLEDLYKEVTLDVLGQAPILRCGPLSIWVYPCGGEPQHFDVCSRERPASFRELPAAVIGVVEALNETDRDLFVPSGWIVEGLSQARVVIDDVWLEPRSAAPVGVACVERGRWSAPLSPQVGGRAPLTVRAAGWGLAPGTSRWNVNPDSRQQFVWSAVGRFERLTGPRPTSSLTQIMREDVAQSRGLADAAAAVDEIGLHDACGLAVQFLYRGVRRTLYLEEFRGAGDVSGLIRDTLKGLLMDFSYSFRFPHRPVLAPIQLPDLELSFAGPGLVSRSGFDPVGREVHRMAIARDLYAFVG